MKSILVTGYQGFVGKNLTDRLEKDRRYRLLKFGKNQNDQELKQMLIEADFIFHLAGVNRPLEISEFFEGNAGLTKKIVDMLISANKKTGIVYSSSIQAEFDNPYGISKALAEKELIKYKENTGAKVYLYRLPNLFGRGVKPNYNSVVATFLYNIKYDKEITINDPDKQLTLVYIDDLLDEFICVMEGKKELREGFYAVGKEYKITLKDLAECIYEIKAGREFDHEIYKALSETYLTY